MLLSPYRLPITDVDSPASYSLTTWFLNARLYRFIICFGFYPILILSFSVNYNQNRSIFFGRTLPETLVALKHEANAIFQAGCGIEFEQRPSTTDGGNQVRDMTGAW